MSGVPVTVQVVTFPDHHNDQVVFRPHLEGVPTERTAEALLRLGADRCVPTSDGEGGVAVLDLLDAQGDIVEDRYVMTVDDVRWWVRLIDGRNREYGWTVDDVFPKDAS